MRFDPDVQYGKRCSLLVSSPTSFSRSFSRFDLAVAAVVLVSHKKVYKCRDLWRIVSVTLKPVTISGLANGQDSFVVHYVS